MDFILRRDTILQKKNLSTFLFDLITFLKKDIAIRITYAEIDVRFGYFFFNSFWAQVIFDITWGSKLLSLIRLNSSREGNLIGTVEIEINFGWRIDL